MVCFPASLQPKRQSCQAFFQERSTTCLPQQRMTIELNPYGKKPCRPLECCETNALSHHENSKSQRRTNASFQSHNSAFPFVRDGVCFVFPSHQADSAPILSWVVSPRHANEKADRDLEVRAEQMRHRSLLACHGCYACVGFTKKRETKYNHYAGTARLRDDGSFQAC